MNDKFNLSSFECYERLPEGGRAAYLCNVYGIMKMYVNHADEWNVDFISGYTDSKDNKVLWYFFTKDGSEFNFYLNQFIKDFSRLKELEDYITRKKEEVIKKIKSVDIEKISNEDLSEAISYYYQKFEEMLRAAAVLRITDRALMPRLKDICRRLKIKESSISILSTSSRKSFSSQEHLALLNLAIKSEKFNKANIEKQINIIHDKFRWSAMGYYDEKPKSINDYQNELNALIKNNSDKLFKNLKIKEKEELERRKELIAKLDNNERIISDISAEASYLKDYYKSSANEMGYYVEPLFHEIAKRTSKPLDFIKSLFPEETTALILGKKLDERRINDRIKHNILIAYKKQFIVLTGKEANEFSNKYDKIENMNKKELKGRIACEGYAKGKAKIIRSTSDFHKLNKGDILVAVNTSPDFIPIMKKASAIIAEEGGVTTHTAVVSRELGIPCIVGITDAVRIFKDDELLEVDANKGIVRRRNE